MWFEEKSAAKMGTCVLGQGIFVSCNRHQSMEINALYQKWGFVQYINR